MNSVEVFWKRFLEKTGRDSNTTYLEVFHFCLTEKLANELLDLVLCGKKRATASNPEIFMHEGSELPQVGDLSIVTDWEGTPRCVIETKAIMSIPFKEMTFDICKREGEDECLETWQEGHIRFFTQEAKALNLEWNTDKLVLFEDFQVVYQE